MRPVAVDGWRAPSGRRLPRLGTRHQCCRGRCGALRPDTDRSHPIGPGCHRTIRIHHRPIPTGSPPIHVTCPLTGTLQADQGATGCISRAPEKRISAQQPQFTNRNNGAERHTAPLWPSTTHSWVCPRRRLLVGLLGASRLGRARSQPDGHPAPAPVRPTARLARPRQAASGRTSTGLDDVSGQAPLSGCWGAPTLIGRSRDPARGGQRSHADPRRSCRLLPSAAGPQPGPSSPQGPYPPSVPALSPGLPTAGRRPPPATRRRPLPPCGSAHNHTRVAPICTNLHHFAP